MKFSDAFKMFSDNTDMLKLSNKQMADNNIWFFTKEGITAGWKGDTLVRHNISVREMLKDDWELSYTNDKEIRYSRT